MVYNLNFYIHLLIHSSFASTDIYKHGHIYLYVFSPIGGYTHFMYHGAICGYLFCTLHIRPLFIFHLSRSLLHLSWRLIQVNTASRACDSAKRRLVAMTPHDAFSLLRTKFLSWRLSLYWNLSRYFLLSAHLGLLECMPWTHAIDVISLTRSVLAFYLYLFLFHPIFQINLSMYLNATLRILNTLSNV